VVGVLTIGFLWSDRRRLAEGAIVMGAPWHEAGFVGQPGVSIPHPGSTGVVLCDLSSSLRAKRSNPVTMDCFVAALLAMTEVR
jgi:hypothetical protein